MGSMAISTTRKRRSLVVCLSNDGYAASLEPRKIYVALRDAVAERQGLLRVVDESGEDYALLPRALRAVVAAAWAAAGLGGAIYNNGSAAPTLINCILVGNQSLDDGGAIFDSSNAKPTLIGCTELTDKAGVVTPLTCPASKRFAPLNSQ